MKTITTAAIVALMTAAVGLTAVAPAIAQDAQPAPTQQVDGKAPAHNFRHDNKGPRHGGPRDFLSFERGAEAVEVALVRLSHRIDMTAEQQALFDTFRTDALAAAETFSTTVEGLRPTEPAEGQAAPDLAERLENRIAIGTAQVAALEAVQPSLTAFFASLTDEQKASLTPQRPDRPGGPGMFGRDGHHRPGFGPMGGPDEAPAPESNG